MQQHWRRAIVLGSISTLSAHIPQGMNARSSLVSLSIGILAHAPPAQVSPRDLPRMACCAPFLLPSSKMNHSFGDISPTNSI